MADFRKKPIVIQAIQWDGNNFGDICGLSTEISWPHGRNGAKYLEIKTKEGTMRASIGDWVIKGVMGEVYPCKPDIFEATYEPSQSVALESELDALREFYETVNQQNSYVGAFFLTFSNVTKDALEVCNKKLSNVKPY